MAQRFRCACAQVGVVTTPLERVDNHILACRTRDRLVSLRLGGADELDDHVARTAEPLQAHNHKHETQKLAGLHFSWLGGVGYD